MLRKLWTGCSEEQAQAAQEALLRRFVTSPFTLRNVPVELSSGTEHIATLEMNPDAPGPAIVWAHGAGAGIGFGYKNYDALANLGGIKRRVLAFDWLGQANSSRPKFPTEHFSALRFFTDSLEAWRAVLGVEEMDLFAHSTGGFVAAHYAMAYPSRVAHLVLHGAAGLGSHPTPAPHEESQGPPKFMLRLWESHFLNFGTIQRLGRLGREPGRRRFHRFQSYRAGITDEVELDLLYDYFWSALCGAPQLA